MELLGRATIHPALLYSGKSAGYVCWVLLGLTYAGVDLFPGVRSPALAYGAFVASASGIALIVLSIVHLKRSTRRGQSVFGPQFERYRQRVSRYL